MSTIANDIALCEPEISGNEWKFVKECLDSGWVSSAGPFVTRLEETVSALAGMSCGVATTSGTAALHLALLVANVQPDDEVLVSDLTFIAPVNVIRYVGAHPVLIDCDPKTLQIDVSLVEHFLRNQCRREQHGVVNKKTGRRVAAVIPVHLLGHPVEIEALTSLCNEFSIPVIEDATESLGASYRNRPVGGHGLISCFSFNGNKIVTAGGGGVLATNDSKLADRARYFSTQAKDDPLYYVHNEIGYNYRLTNLQAALCVAQLERLTAFVEAKRSIARRYAEQFGPFRRWFTLPEEQPDAFSTFWLYTIVLSPEFASQRDPLLRSLAAQRIQARPLWNPVHCNPPFAGCEFIGQHHSTDVVKRAVSLPSSVGLKPEQQERVCAAVLGHFQSLG